MIHVSNIQSMTDYCRLAPLYYGNRTGGLVPIISVKHKEYKNTTMLACTLNQEYWRAGLA